MFEKRIHELKQVYLPGFRRLVALGIFALALVLTSTLRVFGQNYIQEKARLHIDKELYMAGEAIWGKVYLTDALLEAPSILSKVAFVEFWDENGNLVVQHKVALTQGSGAFRIPISTEQNTGYYQIRAYSKWMANASSQDFATHTLRIFNPSDPIPLAQGTQASNPVSHKVQLFPEGGSLVHGLNNRVGVRIEDDRGNPATGIGRVEQVDGTIVAVFESNSAGLASFNISPDSNQTYGLRLLESPDSSKLYALPAIAAQGAVLKLTQKNQSWDLVLNLSPRPEGALYVKGSKEGYECYSQELTGLGEELSTSIPQGNFPSGKCLIHIEDASGEVLAWRYVYAKQPDYLKLSLKISSPTVGTREKITLDLETRDTQGKSCASDLAVSVRKKWPLSKDSRLVPQIPEELELLSQGPPASLSKRQDLIIPELFGISVGGKVKNNKGIPARVILSIPGKVPYLRTLKTNEEGIFNFALEPVYGVREVGLLAVDDDGTPLSLELDPVFYGETPYPSRQKLRFSQEELTYLNEAYVRNQLLLAYQDTFPLSSESKVPSLLSFFGAPDREYILDEYTRFDTEETFNEIVYSVALRKKRGDFYFRVYNQVTGILMKDAPLVLFDGIPLIDANPLLKINSKLIEKIEVLSSVYYQDDFTLYGIVSVTSFRGDASVLALPNSYFRKPFTFLNIPREFVKVSYSQNKNSRIPDQRTLLHWEPKLATGPSGNVQTEFYTSDVPGIYEVRVTGLNSDGLWVEETQEFEVVSSLQR